MCCRRLRCARRCPLGLRGRRLRAACRSRWGLCGRRLRSTRRSPLARRARSLLRPPLLLRLAHVLWVLCQEHLPQLRQRRLLLRLELRQKLGGIPRRRRLLHLRGQLLLVPLDHLHRHLRLGLAAGLGRARVSTPTGTGLHVCPRARVGHVLEGPPALRLCLRLRPRPLLHQLHLYEELHLVVEQTGVEEDVLLERSPASADMHAAHG